MRMASSVPEDLLTRLNGCNDVTLGVNLVKAGIAGGNLVLAVEQIVARQEQPKAKLQIATGLILQALSLWHRNVVAKSQAEQGQQQRDRQPDPELGRESQPTTQRGPGSGRVAARVGDGRHRRECGLFSGWISASVAAYFRFAASPRSHARLYAQSKHRL